jgi:hypothetical protein
MIHRLHILFLFVDFEEDPSEPEPLRVTVAAQAKEQGR